MTKCVPERDSTRTTEPDSFQRHLQANSDVPKWAVQARPFGVDVHVPAPNSVTNFVPKKAKMSEIPDF